MPWELARAVAGPQAVAVAVVARSQLSRAAAEQQVRIPPWLGVVQQPLPRWAAVPLATHLLQQIQDWGLTGGAGRGSLLVLRLVNSSGNPFQTPARPKALANQRLCWANRQPDYPHPRLLRVILPASNYWGVAIDQLQQREPQSPRQYQLQEQALVHPPQYC